MPDQQTVVAVGGLGLAGVNFWVSPQRPAITAVVWGDKSGDPVAAHKAMLEVGAELLLVLVMFVAAGSSGTVANAMVAVVVVLWILWAIRRYGGRKPTTAAMPITAAAATAARFGLGSTSPMTAGAPAAPAATFV